MTEKNIFAYKPDLSFQIYIYFLCENCKIAPTPLWKKLPPSKTWGPVKPQSPLLKIWLEVQLHLNSPQFSLFYMKQQTRQ